MNRVARIMAVVLAPGLGVNVFAAAGILSGTVTNGTTGQPAAGDEVILMSVSSRVTGVARGKTDAAGRFRFETGGTPAPHLVRVLHQGVVYDRPASSGVSSLDVQVYDVAARLDGVTSTWDVIRLQTEGDTLQVVEEITVRNASDPPRTLMSERPFEIRLPPEADLAAGKVQIGGGQPFMHKPAPGGQKDQYYFPVPLPPGETRFAVAYRLPYRGGAVIEPKLHYPLERFMVVLPKTMKFEVKTGGAFRPMPGKTEAKARVVTAAVKPGQPLAFRFSGTGTLVERQGGQQQAQGANTVGPGGRLPPSAGSRERLDNYHWFLLGAVALVMVAGGAGLLAHKRRQPRHVSG